MPDPQPPKPRKKGCLLRMIVLVVVVVAIAIAVLVSRINTLAKQAIERAGTEAMGVDTTVNEVDIALWAGSAKIEQFAIANPPGFKDAHFLKLGHLAAALNLRSLRGTQVQIPYIRLRNIEINLEKTINSGNYKVLMDHLDKATATATATGTDPGTDPATDPATEGGDAKRYIIRELSIHNITANITAPIVGTTTMTLDKISLHNIGSDNAGVKMKEIVGLVVRSILAAIARRGTSVLPQDLLNDLQLPGIDTQQLQQLGFELIGSAGEQALGLTEGLGEVRDVLTDKNLTAEQKAQKVLGTVGKQTGKTAERAKKNADKLLKGLGGMFKNNNDKSP